MTGQGRRDEEGQVQTKIFQMLLVREFQSLSDYCIKIAWAFLLFIEMRWRGFIYAEI